MSRPLTFHCIAGRRLISLLVSVHVNVLMNMEQQLCVIDIHRVSHRDSCVRAEARPQLMNINEQIDVIEQRESVRAPGGRIYDPQRCWQFRRAWCDTAKRAPNITQPPNLMFINVLL